MCRIVGAIGRTLDSTFIKNVFLESEHMGRDATGFWFPTTDIVKKPKKVSEFLPEVEDIFEEGVKTSHVFLGHTRYATHGKPEFNYNNHPIESENWIVVHNGIVHMKDLKDYQYTTDTDTENILAYIEKFGIVKGLEYCSSGASIILTNKSEKDTIYIWRTLTGDMAVGYDLKSESIYISSGSKYFWEAIKPEMKLIDRLGGLFAISNRTLRVVEPGARELWKLQYKNKKVHGEKIATVPVKGWAYSSSYNGMGGYGNAYGYTNHSSYQRREADPNAHLFVALGTAPSRPATERKKLEAETQATTQNNTQKSIVKSSNNNTEAIYSGDVVRFKRELRKTDIVNAEKPYLVQTIDTFTEFTVKKFITDDRVLIIRADDEESFSAPLSLLKLVPAPFCMGILRSPHKKKCLECLFEEDCSLLSEAYTDIPKPQCIGQWNNNDEECVMCIFLSYCVGMLDVEENISTPPENKFLLDYIDAEYKEVNETIVGDKNEATS